MKIAAVTEFEYLCEPFNTCKLDAANHRSLGGSLRSRESSVLVFGQISECRSTVTLSTRRSVVWFYVTCSSDSMRRSRATPRHCSVVNGMPARTWKSTSGRFTHPRRRDVPVMYLEI